MTTNSDRNIPTRGDDERQTGVSGRKIVLLGLAIAMAVAMIVAIVMGMRAWEGGRRAPAAVRATANDIQGSVRAEGTTRFERIYPLTAPRRGVITRLRIREGQRIGVGDELVRVNDLPLIAMGARIPLARTLRLGARGPDVAALQVNLKRLGCSAGRVDGKFGRKTAAALRRFQSSRGLPPTGAIGPDTARFLPLPLVVGRLRAGQGDASRRGVLADLVDTRSLVAQVAVDSTQAPLVKPGQQVDVKLEAKPGQALSGKVAAVSPRPTTSATQSTHRATILLTRAAPVALAGARVEAAIDVGLIKNATIVPAAAIRQDGGESFVTVLERRGLIRRLVATGVRSGPRVQITGGLEAGESVSIGEQVPASNGASALPYFLLAGSLLCSVVVFGWTGLRTDERATALREAGKEAEEAEAGPSMASDEATETDGKHGREGGDGVGRELEEASLPAWGEVLNAIEGDTTNLPAGFKDDIHQLYELNVRTNRKSDGLQRGLAEVYEYTSRLEENEYLEAVKARIEQVMRRQGIQAWEPAVGEPAPHGCEKVPVREDGQVPGTVVSVISAGFRADDGTVILRATVGVQMEDQES